MAGKDNASASTIDKTTFFWAALCAVCHPGGGPAEYDRDGELLYDEQTGQFGYEKLGKTADQVVFDGDYSFLNPGTGAIGPAPWNVTGLAEPDCLLCHRKDRTVVDGKNMNWIWRSAALRGSANLKNSAGESVPAFASAATAGQGWFSELVLGQVPAGSPPMATALQIDYSKGVQDGSLVESDDGTLRLAGDRLAEYPKDMACWGCHGTPDLKKRGRVWFDPSQDVHYAGFNDLDEPGADNAVATVESTACSRCHQSGMDHRIAKGNAFLGSVENETDYLAMRTCRDCHDPQSPLRDPEAPAMQGGVHIIPGHLATLSCQACHIPYKQDSADMVVDNAVTGSTVAYKTDEYLSADPLDPSNADRSRWYPSMKLKTDKDGVSRLFPAKLLLSVWWGDWDQNDTPDNMSDDVVEPVALWRVRQVTAGAPLGAVTDDNGDGKPEVNRPEEIVAYVAALRGNDSYGNQIASLPVLVKGGHLWYEDPDNAGQVLSVSYEEAGIKAESSHPFGIDHNVLPSGTAIGAASCNDCHLSSFIDDSPDIVTESPFFDRAVLVDPFGPDAAATPLYETIREIANIDPP